MTAWENRIVNAFTARYPASSAASGSEGRPLRLRLDHVFPGFIDASADSRESFLEAAEALEQRGLLAITWTRHRKGEIPSTLVCSAPERLFELTGKSSPRSIAAEVRDLALGLAGAGGADGTEWRAFCLFLAESFTPLDAAGGIDAAVLKELARLAGFSPDAGLIPGPPRPEGPRPERFRGITTRALSVALYRDSKRLEYLLDLFSPLLNRARRQGIAVPDFSFLDRSYPETLIAGKAAFEFTEEPAEQQPICPLVNASGSILGLPLETILKLRRIRPLTGPHQGPLTEGPPLALTVENKESFFALSPSLPGYTCFLYTAGHPNRAVRALVSLLADSGFELHHAGDLDPDGILILQELGDIAGKIPRPLRMDADTFDQYRDCGRKLEPSAVKRTALIRDTTRSIPGIAELIRRIEETGRGVEQEIIDYRNGPEPGFPGNYHLDKTPSLP